MNTGWILGLNAYHGDAAAAVVRDGEVVAALAEERLSRIKHAAGFPALAAAEVLRQAQIEPAQLTAIAVGRDPQAHWARKVGHVLRHWTRPAAIAPRLQQRRNLAGVRAALAAALDLPEPALAHVPVDTVEHHLAHAASAFYGSPYPRAAVVTADGFGDFVSTTWGGGDGLRLELRGRVFFPHSLGVLYQAVTQFIGFPHYGDEGKTMGLAPYGSPRLVDQVETMVALKPDGAFALVPRWFTHLREGVATAWSDATPEVGPLYSAAWTAAFGPPRQPGAPLGEREADLAFAAQAVLERVLAHVLGHAAWATGAESVALAGGVALNSVFNGKIPHLTTFKESFVFPAAGDDGLAVGAAWWSHVQRGGARPAAAAVPLWGPRFATPRDHLDLTALAAHADVTWREAGDQVFALAAAALASGAIVGWFRGGCEFGPRALGARSILADPRQPGMKERLNARVKHREPFRPFAPAVLRMFTSAWFASDVESPAMLHVLPFRPEQRGAVPAVAHVDGSGRLQTVDEASHPDFARLIGAFAALTGVPLVLNTSFNENEPIVTTPQQALDCFLRTDIDALAIEGLWFERQRGDRRS